MIHGGRGRAAAIQSAAQEEFLDAEQTLEATSAAVAACERQARAEYVARARPAYVAACLMQAATANDTLRRHGPVAELLGSSVPAWPELDARLDGWMDTVRELGVEV